VSRPNADNALAGLVAIICAAFIVALYGLAVLLLVLTACGCTLHVGEAPCEAFAAAVEARMGDCGMLPDDWYEEQVRRLRGQCDPGALGITLVDADDAADCVDEVRATTCEQLQRRGAPSCMGEVKL
jgi:hypothetical protein